MGVSIETAEKWTFTNEENGITPKDGGLFWPKHFIALGKLADGRMCCCAVFDSDIHVFVRIISKLSIL